MQLKNFPRPLQIHTHMRMQECVCVCVYMHMPYRLWQTGFQMLYLGEADKHQQGKDVGVLQLERKLLDAVVCKGSNDISPQWGIVE